MTLIAPNLSKSVKQLRHHGSITALFYLVIIPILLVPGFIAAQSSVRFERITVEDGLSQSAITSMVQDKFGYLWIGTLDGLNRYDGNTFTVYRSNQAKPHSIPSHSIHKLFLDDRDRLWISYRNGLSLYQSDHDNFRNYKIQIDQRNLFVRDLDLLSDSLIILCTNFGILDFNPHTGDVRPSNMFSRFTNHNIYGLIFANSEFTWLFEDKSIWRKENNGNSWIEVFTDEKQIRPAYVDNTGELYVRTSNQLWKHDSIGNNFKMIAHIPEDQWPNSYDILKTNDGKLWVAHGGISIYDHSNKLITTLFHVPQDPNSLSGAFASDICETRDGVVWVGTNGLGLNKYNPARSVFSYLGNFPGAPLTLADNYILSAYTDDDQTIIVNTLDGLNVINLPNQTSRHFPVPGRDGTSIRKVFKDSKGQQWLATNRGLMKFDGSRIRSAEIKLLNDPELAIYDVESVNGSEFLLTTSKGLIHWDQKTNAANVLMEMGSLVLRRIGNTFWYETGEKLSIMRWQDKKIIKTFPVNGTDSLQAPLASVKCIFQDSDKNVWIGTDGGGLSLYDSISQTFQHFRDSDGLVNNVVYGILEDAAENLWLSTNEGLCVLNRSTKKFIRTFNKTDGLQGNEFNTRAYFKSAAGKMYFGGVNGLSFFSPEEALHVPSSTPQTVLTAFFINNIKQSNLEDSQLSGLFSRHEIELDWSQRNFGFEIAGLGFTFPRGVQYQYKMEEFDQQWNSIGSQNRITFTNMPAGNYTLRVKAGNSFGDWEQEGLSIQIMIISPFWRSAWFLAGVISFIILMIFFFNFQRTRFLKKRASLLQKLVDVRTREIQVQQEEIATQNEELTAQAEALENSNAELEKRVEQRTRTLKRLNGELVDQNTQLEQFTFITAHNIRGPIARIRGLVNLMKPDTNKEVINHLHTSINTLDEVIADLNTVLNVTHGINKKFESVSVREQLILVQQTLHPDVKSINAVIDIEDFEEIQILGLRAYFQSIFYNLIHNALKYANHLKNPVIKCQTRISEDRIVITIEDNGIGIDMRYARDKVFKLHQRFHPNIAGKGFGLFLVKTQVTVMGGKIEVESEVEKGTKFILEFPKAGNSHQDDSTASPEDT